MGKRFYLYNLCRLSALVRAPEDRQLRRGLCMNGTPTTEDRQLRRGLCMNGTPTTEDRQLLRRLGMKGAPTTEDNSGEDCA